MSKRVLPAIALAMALIAAACGGDDKQADTSTTAAAPSSAASGSTAGSTAGGSTNGPGTTVAGADCKLDKPLKIGYAADLGELGAFADQPGSEAAKVMIDEINAAGGVGGKPVEYIVKDIQGDPAATQRAAQELLDAGANALIGPPFPNTGQPLLDTAGAKAPIVFMSSTDATLANPAAGGYLASFSDKVQSSAVAEFALSKGFKSAITMSSNDDVYFSGNPKYFKDAFEHGGGKVLKDFTFSLTDTDFSTQVNQIAAMAEKPQVLYTAMIMGQIQTLLEQLRAAGLNDVVVMGPDGFDATVIWGAGKVADGVFFAAHTFPREGNDVQAFLDRATKAGAKIETVSFGALAADAVQIIVAAALQSCSSDGPTISKAINELSDLKVTTGSITYKGRNGVPDKDVSILTVKDGKPAFETAIRPKYVAGS